MPTKALPSLKVLHRAISRAILMATLKVTHRDLPAVVLCRLVLLMASPGDRLLAARALDPDRAGLDLRVAVVVVVPGRLTVCRLTVCALACAPGRDLVCLLQVLTAALCLA